MYEKFVTYDEVDEWSHFAAAAAEYQLNDRTAFNFLNRFSLTQSINEGPLVPEQDAAGDDIEDVPDSEVRRDDVYRNHAALSMAHNFTARTVGNFAVVNDYYDSDRANTSKSFSLATTGDLEYALSARDKLGGGAGFSWQRYDDVRGQPESDTFIYRLFASWVHNFGADTELKIQVGPAVIYTDQKKADGTSADVYPHFEVTGGKTIREAYAALGLNVPSDVQDLGGNSLLADLDDELISLAELHVDLDLVVLEGNERE